MSSGQLFEVEPVGTPGPGDIGSHGSVAKGGAAQFEAIALLLRLGHKVAVPVVDDDGVDLVVNYRTTVQVKHTGRQKRGVHYVYLEQSNSYHRRSGLPRRSAVRPHVDVFLIHVEDGGWYVIPREAMPARALSLGPAAQQWREAWEIFRS